MCFVHGCCRYKLRTSGSHIKHLLYHLSNPPPWHLLLPEYQFSFRIIFCISPATMVASPKSHPCRCCICEKFTLPLVSITWFYRMLHVFLHLNFAVRIMVIINKKFWLPAYPVKKSLKVLHKTCKDDTGFVVQPR